LIEAGSCIKEGPGDSIQSFMACNYNATDKMTKTQNFTHKWMTDNADDNECYHNHINSSTTQKAIDLSDILYTVLLLEQYIRHCYYRLTKVFGEDNHKCQKIHNREKSKIPESLKWPKLCQFPNILGHATSDFMRH